MTVKRTILAALAAAAMWGQSRAADMLFTIDPSTPASARTNRTVVFNPVMVWPTTGSSLKAKFSRTTDSNGQVWATNLATGLWTWTTLYPPESTTQYFLSPTNTPTGSGGWQPVEQNEVATPSQTLRPQDYPYSAAAMNQILKAYARTNTGGLGYVPQPAAPYLTNWAQIDTNALSAVGVSTGQVVSIMQQQGALTNLQSGVTLSNAMSLATGPYNTFGFPSLTFLFQNPAGAPQPFVESVNPSGFVFDHQVSVSGSVTASGGFNGGLNGNAATASHATAADGASVAYGLDPTTTSNLHAYADATAAVQAAAVSNSLAMLVGSNTAGVASWQGKTGIVTMASADVTGALGYAPQPTNHNLTLVAATGAVSNNASGLSLAGTWTGSVNGYASWATNASQATVAIAANALTPGAGGTNNVFGGPTIIAPSFVYGPGGSSNYVPGPITVAGPGYTKTIDTNGNTTFVGGAQNYSGAVNSTGSSLTNVTITKPTYFGNWSDAAGWPVPSVKANSMVGQVPDSYYILQINNFGITSPNAPEIWVKNSIDYIATNGVPYGCNLLMLEEGWSGRDWTGHLQFNTNWFAHTGLYWSQYAHLRGVKIIVQVSDGGYLPSWQPTSVGYEQQDLQDIGVTMDLDGVKVDNNGGNLNMAWALGQVKKPLYVQYSWGDTEWNPPGVGSVEAIAGVFSRSVAFGTGIGDPTGGGSFTNAYYHLLAEIPVLPMVQRGFCLDGTGLLWYRFGGPYYPGSDCWNYDHNIWLSMAAQTCSKICMMPYLTNGSPGWTLTNTEYWDVHRDPLVIPCDVWSLSNSTYTNFILSRKLTDSRIVTLVNADTQPHAMTIWASTNLCMGVGGSSVFTLSSIWYHGIEDWATNSYTVTVPPTNTLFLRVWPGLRKPGWSPALNGLSVGTNYLSDLPFRQQSILCPTQSNGEFVYTALSRDVLYGTAVPPTIGSTTYPKGFWVGWAGANPSNSTVMEFALGGDADMFYTDFGVSSSYGVDGGALRLTVYLDGVQAWQSDYVNQPGSYSKTNVALSVTGHNFLKLAVDSWSGNASIGGTAPACLGGCYVVKNGTPVTTQGPTVSFFLPNGQIASFNQGLLVSVTNLDTDVSTFLTRASLTTNSTEALGLHVFVTSGKANGWWAASDAIYPMVGATLTTRGLNLKANSYNVSFTAPAALGASGGVSFDGSSTWSTGFNPTTAGGQMTETSCYIMMVAQSVTNDASNWQTAFGNFDGSHAVAIRYQQSNADVDTFGLNCFGFSPSLILPYTLGPVVCSRSGTACFGASTAATFTGSSANGSGLMNASIRIAGTSGYADDFKGTLTGAGFGAGLTMAQAQQFVADWNTLNATLGR